MSKITFLIRVTAAAALMAIPSAVFAQWPAYPSAKVPKLPDGKPNLDGPTPRTPDGHPDFSGVWEFVDAARGSRPARSGVVPGSAPFADGNSNTASSAEKPAAAASSANAAPAAIAAPDAPKAPFSFRSQFWNIGLTVPGGLPFTPWAQKVRAERVANNNKDNPDAHCLPMGLMQFHTHPQPRKIVQTPDLMVIMYEANYGLRQVFMDGRPLPKPDDVEPWWYGYSVGHWEGDTLVVETVGFRDDVWLDVEGSPLTSSGKMIERFRRPTFGHLVMDITVEDPKAYTKPWTVEVSDKLMLNTELIEFICNENEQSDAHLVGKEK